MLCVGVNQVSSLGKLGLARKNWSESWIEVCHDSISARELILKNEEILEVWVYGSDDMEALNLAAGLKFERKNLRVFLLAESSSGSFLSRCDAAHVVARVGQSAVVGLFRSAEQIYGRPLTEIKSEETSSVVTQNIAAKSEIILSEPGLLDKELLDEKEVSAIVSNDKTVPFKVISSADKQVPNVLLNRSTTEPSSRDSFVLSIVSGSGGSGKSSVAAIVATLAQSTGAKTLALDADFQFGDQQWLLGRKAPFDLVELARRGNRVLELVPDGNLPAVVSAPIRLEESEFAIASIKQLIALARSDFDIIVVNTGSFWMDAHLDLLESSDQTLFLMDQRPTSIRACSHAIELCVRCGLPLQRFSFALNRCSRQALLSSLDASCALKGVKVREFRDGGKDVSELLGAGLPLELIDSKNPFVLDLVGYVDEVLPLPSSAVKISGEANSRGFMRRRLQKQKKRRAS